MQVVNAGASPRREHLHELIEDLMHDGELGAGHCLKGRLVTRLGAESIPVQR